MLITIGPNLLLVRAFAPWAEVVDGDVRLGMMRVVVMVILIYLVVPVRALGVARETVLVLLWLALAVVFMRMIGFSALVAAVVFRLAVGLAIAWRTVVIAAVLFPWRAFLPALVASLIFGAAVRLAMILVVKVVLVLLVAVPVIPMVLDMLISFLAVFVPVAIPVLVIALVITPFSKVLATTPVIVPVVAILVTFLIERVTGVFLFVVLLVARPGVGVLVARILDNLRQSSGGSIVE